ncbi:MAG: serine/threonine-protein kinase [Gammaproteobacteria bacterium]|nr:serine/threonine-protein kinase [Gammaproteobacteria bacterium]
MLRARQKLGKYRIEKKIANGPLAAVYQAFDSIHGVRVALKIPQPTFNDEPILADFRKEVQIASKLEHENILPIQNASYIDGRFVIVTLMGEGTLADRLEKRTSLKTRLHLCEQALDAVAYAHSRKVIHCDIKPENFILFPGNRLRLTDFGLAKMVARTIKASGSGTVGYVAPEQALGRPMFQSDVFSLGLIFYRVFSGHLPEWPFDWPPPGYDNLRDRLHADFIGLIHKAIELRPSARYRNAIYMQTAFRKLKHRTLKQSGARRGRKSGNRSGRNWQIIQRREFERRYRKVLDISFNCKRCSGPLSEYMQACPWCGTKNSANGESSTFPAHCPSCKRGVKLDWRYCAWCYGRGFAVATTREYSDRRYSARCANSGCSRKVLMPFMRYCPWCRSKVKRKWKLPESKDKCPSCGWGVVKEFWGFCPWCSKTLSKR